MSRIHAECNAYRHSGFQIGNARSLPVHSDFSELRDRKCSRCLLLAHGDRVTGYTCDDWLLIRWCRLGFPPLTECRCNRDRSKKNPDDQQPVHHHLRLAERTRLHQTKSLNRESVVTFYESRGLVHRCSHSAVSPRGWITLGAPLPSEAATKMLELKRSSKADLAASADYRASEEL